MTIEIDRLESFLVNAREWLDLFPEPGTEPRRSSQVLIGEMQRVLALGNRPAVRSSIDRLIKLSDKIQGSDPTGTPELCLIRVACGLAAYRIRSYPEALTLLESAIEISQKCQTMHLEGTIRYILGCIQWQLPGQDNDAILSWEMTLQIYRELERRNRGTYVTTRSDWYSARLAEISSQLELALQPAEIPSPSETGARPATSGGPASSARRRGTSTQHLLQTLPVVGQIPAGMPLEVLPVAESYLNIDRLQISDVEYYVVSLLRGERIVRIPTETYYYVMKVSGNSMNQSSPEPIHDGDYVILRKQYTADNGEIVAALIVKDQGEGERLATLKRYFCRDGKVVLRPESDDPRFQKPVYTSRIFNQPNEEIQIRGVAIGVLKPV